jgi:MFS family permease
MTTHRATAVLLNVAHALDHMFLLIFATAVTAIAADFGIARWEDLMPYGVGAFFLFGVGSLPAGRLGDLWGRRPMMIVFFVGIGLASLAVALAQSPWQLAGALALMGAFASIYHPVGIPMLLQGASRPGWTIGINGLSGNLGLALAALVTGLLVAHLGWRAAFAVPGVLSIACGVLFAAVAPREAAPPARRQASASIQAGVSLRHLLLVMTVASTVGSLLFNFSTNAGYEMLADRLRDAVRDPARLGLVLAGVYAVAAVTQVLVGQLIDRFALRPLYLSVMVGQALLIALSTQADGWTFVVLQLLFMAFVFGAIPFNDAMVVRFVDDRLRSRVAGMRLAVSFGASSLAVWLIGPVVKQSGFGALLWVMAGCSLLGLLVVMGLPAGATGRSPQAGPGGSSQPR